VRYGNDLNSAELANPSVGPTTVFRLWMSLLISASLHLGLAVLLAMVLVVSQRNGSGTIHLNASDSDADQSVPELAELDMSSSPSTSTEESNSQTIALDLPTNELDFESLSSGSMRVPIRAVSTDAISGKSLVGGMQVILQESDKPKSSRATFFGAQAEGNRFVFVIDSSGSMRGPRWMALAFELCRTIRALSPDQEFFVISFDYTAHPMFGIAPPIGKFLLAKPDDISKFENWLRGVVPGGGTYPSEAVGIALKLKPDAIFLLSDGEIQDSTVAELRTYNHMMDENGYPKTLIPIHTILLHSQIGYATLETIALENSGTFTPVPFRPMDANHRMH
jgi:hypothetical protein